MSYAIDGRRARATARVIAHRIKRGLDLLGWCALAWFGSAMALLALVVDLLRRFSAMGERHAQQLDRALVALLSLAHEQLHAPASSVPVLTLLVIGVALLVWSLREIVQWFRHSDKRN